MASKKILTDLHVDGKVGIGTTTPDEQLHVEGNAVFFTGGTSGNIKVGRTSNEHVAVTVADLGTEIKSIQDSDSNGSHYFKLNRDHLGSGADDFKIQKDGDDQLVIDKDGKVGIGTSSPLSKLMVEGSDSTEAGILTLANRSVADNSRTGIEFINSSVDESRAGIYAQRVDSGYNAELSFNTGQSGSTERMRIDSSGNVGIGTTSPSHSLHVADTGNAEIVAERASGAKVIMQSQASRGRIGTDSNHDFRISTNSTDRMTIDTTGNVGIGNTSPAEKLHVNGNIRAGDGTTQDGIVKAYYNDGSHTRMHGYGLYFDRGESYIRPTSSGDKNLNIGHTTNVWNNLKIDSELIKINSMAGHESEGQIRFGRYDGNTTRYNRLTNYVSSTEGSNYMQFEIHNGTENSTVEVMTLKGNGNVGIGTTSPGAKLDVDGDVKFSDYGSGTHTGTLAYKLGVDSSGNIIESAVGAGSVDGSGTTNYITKWTDADTIGDSIIYDDGTNVGIGTASPAQPLHVDGNARVDGDFFIIEANPQIFLSDSNHDSDFSINLNSGLFKITDTTNNADRITLDSSGNVGIGTTSPSDELHVIGDIQASQTLKALKFYSTATDAGVNTLTLGRSDTSSYWNVNHAGNDFRLWNSDGVGTDILLGVNASGVDQSNKVGIGTATPTEKLDVNGNVKAEEGLFDGANNGNVPAESSKVDKFGLLGNRGVMYITNQSATGNIRFGNNGAHGVNVTMSLTSGGSLGIGTTTPTQKLEVDGNVKADSFIKDGGTSSQFLKADGSVDSNTYLTNADIGSYVDGSGSAGKIAKWTDSDSIEDSIITEVSSEIGIGVASPKAKLDVDGGVKIGNDTDSASADKVGTMRYRVVKDYAIPIGHSYVDMCMETTDGGYEWVNIVTNQFDLSI